MTQRLSTLLVSAGAIAALSFAALSAPAEAGAAHRPVVKRAKATKPTAPRPAPKTVAVMRNPAINDFGTPATGSVSRPIGQINLSIGRGQLVNLPGLMKDVFVADDKIADIQVKSNHQLYLYGKGPGETTVYASNAEGRVVWSANVRVGNNIDSVDQMLRVAMPDSHVTVSSLGPGAMLLTGTVSAPEDAAEAQRLVQAFLGKEANVISRLRTATPLQVNLQVRIAEVSRSLVRTIGNNVVTAQQGANGVVYGMSRGRTAGSICYVTSSSCASGLPTISKTITNADGTTSTINLPYNPSTGQVVTSGTYDTFASNLTNSTALSIGGKLFGMDILDTLDLGETAGLVTTLANPNLTAVSGETADFLAGGEFPIPMSSGLGAVSVEYKKYGVSLAYTPTVLSDGRISLRVRPEVSELSTEGAISMNGYSIPSLTTRRTETTVELGSGQSFMIAGLLSNTASQTLEKLPGAGDIPILGNLFKSSTFKKGESELVIIITPYLVKPTNAADIKLPTDGLQTPTEMQQLLGNMMSDGKTGAKRPGPVSAEQAAAQAKVGKADKKAPATATPESRTPGFSMN